jgi:hypothetical protein
MGAQVQVMFPTMPASMQYVRVGKLWMSSGGSDLGGSKLGGLKINE